MALKTKVMVYGINNLSDARYAAGMGVDILLFDLDTISLEQYSAMASWVAGVGLGYEAAETLDFSGLPESIHPQYFIPKNVSNRFSSSAHTHVISSSLETIRLVKTSNLDVLIKELQMGLGLVLWLDEENIAGSKIEDLKKITERYSFWIDTSIPSEEILSFVDYVKPYGFAMKGGKEERPGYKSFEDLADILEVLEEE